MSARDRIHAMFPICDSPTEAEQRETDLDQRLDAYRIEVLAKAGVKYEDCPVCGAAFSLGKSCGTCDFRARMAAEAGGKASAPAPTATPATVWQSALHCHACGETTSACASCGQEIGDVTVPAPPTGKPPCPVCEHGDRYGPECWSTAFPDLARSYACPTDTTTGDNT